MPDHDVDVAGFVLEGDEYHAGCGVRALPAGDDAGGARTPAVRQGADLLGRDKAHARKLRPQERKGMAAERQAEAGVIGDEVLAFGRRHQRRRGF